MRKTKEDVEDISGEGEQECWFGEGGCLESSEMESGVGEIAVRKGELWPPPFMGINLDQNWMMMMMVVIIETSNIKSK